METIFGGEGIDRVAWITAGGRQARPKAGRSRSSDSAPIRASPEHRLRAEAGDAAPSPRAAARPAGTLGS